jgi:hypothetical protein
MSRRSIDETFKTIAPSRLRGVPNPPSIGGAFTTNGGDTASAMSQTTNEISQLRSAYQQQAQLIAANTQALQSNTSAQGGHSAGSAIGSVASSFLGGSLGLLSPIVSGIMGLFGGGPSAPPPLPVYTPPPQLAIDGFLQSQSPASGASASSQNSASIAPTVGQTAPQITVNVSAMDSQSFMDRSSDIASAVREAMLNLHPINDVVANL